VDTSRHGVRRLICVTAAHHAASVRAFMVAMHTVSTIIIS
jgi:hypothetical protein